MPAGWPPSTRPLGVCWQRRTPAELADEEVAVGLIRRAAFYGLLVVLGVLAGMQLAAMLMAGWRP